ncbi:HAD family hydrolase [Parafrankia discariae]|uniref:HAD family hydrolase n=1 Tax=Parafrankia discariae TaxID=365528 RepID=UPI00036AAAA5|nr:HAD family hydrolase [Parafrankia discariae]
MQALALLDLDRTLIDSDAAFHVWAREFVAAHGLHDAALPVLVDIFARHSGLKDSFFATVCRNFGLSDSPAQLWEQYRRRMPELVSCRTEDLDALRRLRRAGWRIGIVTNGMTDNQLGKIRNSGLDRLVDGWCISGDVGVRKPDPEIFRLAIERCGCRTSGGGWMIGDDLAADVAGGQAAGLRTVWLQGGRGADSWPSAGPVPDVSADSVAAAVEVLLGPKQSEPGARGPDPADRPHP